MEFLPLLVTGIAGVAGYNAFHYFSRKYPGRVLGTRRADNWRLVGDGIVPCDADDVDTLRRLFEQYRFRAVLNCEGSCKLKSCELDPQMAWRVNVTAVLQLLELIEAYDARLLHLSVDLVYSGAGSGKYLETDLPDPVTVYGSTMLRQSVFSGGACLRLAFCGSLCRWGSASMDMRERSTGSSHDSGTTGPQRCMSTRSVARHIPIA
jgi:dTDP-4-dehydrorhamnose reductase